MPLFDIKIPADAADQQTTDAKSALPPVEFQVSKTGTSNVLTIHDRQAVQNRAPTASYRIYFLPKAFAPDSEINDPIIRQAGRKVASLVADVSAPSLGTVLKFTDSDNVGQAGYYYCVGVNRAGVEAPPEHIIPVSGSAVAQTAATSSGGISPIIIPVIVETTVGGGATITGTINGINTAFTMGQGFGTTDMVWVDGILDPSPAAVGTALTVSTPPVTFVVVEHIN